MKPLIILIISSLCLATTVHFAVTTDKDPVVTIWFYDRDANSWSGENVPAVKPFPTRARLVIELSCIQR